MNKTTPSPESQMEAMRIAKATQKPGQTKEQTKLIAQGIEKGIALYKKQQKAKSRERDKERKRQLKLKEDATTHSVEPVQERNETATTPVQWLPWFLLVVSWAGFGAYLAFI